jgi:DNA-binding NarL/FixJ family response regulator
MNENNNETNQNRSQNFTCREIEILHLLALGKSRKEIGIALNISTKTVDVFHGQLIGKTGLRNKTASVKGTVYLKG